MMCLVSTHMIKTFPSFHAQCRCYISTMFVWKRAPWDESYCCFITVWKIWGWPLIRKEVLSHPPPRRALTVSWATFGQVFLNYFLYVVFYPFLNASSFIGSKEKEHLLPHTPYNLAAYSLLSIWPYVLLWVPLLGLWHLHPPSSVKPPLIQPPTLISETAKHCKGPGILPHLQVNRLAYHCIIDADRNTRQTSGSETENDLLFILIELVRVLAFFFSFFGASSSRSDMHRLVWRRSRWYLYTQ